ncbi:MAG: DNA adenine methylase [Candidatus Zophobacter franzmannii]|nr:DNA adenine methylase [Candidatus Zophobacter franzmannii]
MSAKPFLKWAGGKTQLLHDIALQIPFRNDDRFVYVEPFVGSGAVLIWILQNYPNIEYAVINDVNSDLMDCYQVIKTNVHELIEELRSLERSYHAICDSPELKKEFYYEHREKYNLREEDVIKHSAIFIFLNRTCFNGLYRVNRKNEFNVPIGSYKKPQICNEENLLSVSKLLEKVEIFNGDFEETIPKTQHKVLFYCDPRYKPLGNTASFNSYMKDDFNDEEQKRLKRFCDKLDDNKFYWILSNSDVKGKDINDDFFDNLYKDYKITRVFARRMINSNPDKRGQLTELMISNVGGLGYVF